MVFFVLLFVSATSFVAREKGAQGPNPTRRSGELSMRAAPGMPTRDVWALWGAPWRVLWGAFCLALLLGVLLGRCGKDASPVSLKHCYRPSTHVVLLRDPEHQAPGAMLQANKVFADFHIPWCLLVCSLVCKRCSMECSLVSSPVCTVESSLRRSLVCTCGHSVMLSGGFSGMLSVSLSCLVCCLAGADAKIVSLKHGYRPSTPVVSLRDPEHQATGAMLQANQVFADLHLL